VRLWRDVVELAIDGMPYVLTIDPERRHSGATPVGGSYGDPEGEPLQSTSDGWSTTGVPLTSRVRGREGASLAATGKGWKMRQHWMPAFCVVAAVAMTALGAGAEMGSDLSLDSVTANVRHARVGQTVTFTITATNLGPEVAVSLDVNGRLPDGFVMVGETCDLGVSPDTPFCEYSNIAVGKTVTTAVVAQVVASGEKTRTYTPCTSSEQAGTDPNPANDCNSVTIRVIGHPK
jgi:uncharacterized repeat protein (TIGR01451 family)